MVKEDLLLQEEMGRLIIQPIKLTERINDNPFNFHMKRSLRMRSHNHNVSCACNSSKKNASAKISKKKSNKILKEPVLQIIKSCVNHNNLDDHECQPECTFASVTCSTDSLNLCTLVKTCNQLKISSDSKEPNAASTSSDENKWWTNSVSSSSSARENKESIQHTQAGSCSQQALNPPCDVTIDELASYFETLVHIPKKMSSMAEMMYI